MPVLLERRVSSGGTTLVAASGAGVGAGIFVMRRKRCGGGTAGAMGSLRRSDLEIVRRIGVLTVGAVRASGQRVHVRARRTRHAIIRLGTDGCRSGAGRVPSVYW